MKPIAYIALLMAAFDAGGLSREEVVVPLQTQIATPCLALRTDDTSKIILPAEELRALVVNRPARPPQMQWPSEEERLAFIAGNRARILLNAGRIAETNTDGCRELEFTAVHHDGHYLVAQMLEAGNAVVTTHGAVSNTIRIVKTNTGCQAGPMGSAQYFAADGTHLLLLTTCVH